MVRKKRRSSQLSAIMITVAAIRITTIFTPLSMSQRHRLSAMVRASSAPGVARSEEHTSELQSRGHLVCRLLLAKKQNNGSWNNTTHYFANNARHHRQTTH